MAWDGLIHPVHCECGAPDCWADGPPEYDPYDDAADQAEAHAASQRELACLEAEETHDAAGETWQAGAYPSGVTDPAGTSGPRGMP